MSKLDKVMEYIQAAKQAPETLLGGLHINWAVESALYLLLKAFREELPALETVEDYNYFHKCFRQNDVVNVGDGAVDMAIWHLLSESRLFWVACEFVIHGKQPDVQKTADAQRTAFETWVSAVTKQPIADICATATTGYASTAVTLAWQAWQAKGPTAKDIVVPTTETSYDDFRKYWDNSITTADVR